MDSLDSHPILVVFHFLLIWLSSIESVFMLREHANQDRNLGEPIFLL